MLRVLLVVILMFNLSGCIGSFSTAAGVTAVVEKKKKEHQNEVVDFTSSQYLNDHANSPCTNNEDKIMPTLVEYVKDHYLRGVDKAIKRLNTIYMDTSKSDEVRASALYNIAVQNFRREDNNPYLGVNYLKKINDEFPGQYDCIFTDTPWRQHMIEKLHIPQDAIPKS